MIKYFCDRCKKECDSYSLLSVNPIMWDEMSLSIDRQNEKYVNHLCPNCYNQFKRFMDRKQILDIKV